MQSISTSLRQAINAEVTTLANCISITRKDGVVIGFTEHGTALTIDGVRYRSLAGFDISTVVHGSSMAADNMTMAGATDGDAISSPITEIDLLAGKYDFAYVELFIVDYTQLDHDGPNSDKIIQKCGTIGEISLQNDLFYAELRGLTQYLSKEGICDVYSICCRANLGDKKCGVDLTQYTHTASVSKITGPQIFVCKDLEPMPISWFTGGVVHWHSGKNKGLSMEVKDFAHGIITLALPMPFAININDRFDIVAGCDKSFITCRHKFHNVLNFRGEPDLAAVDRLKSRF